MKKLTLFFNLTIFLSVGISKGSEIERLCDKTEFACKHLKTKIVFDGAIPILGALFTTCDKGKECIIAQHSEGYKDFIDNNGFIKPEKLLDVVYYSLALEVAEAGISSLESRS